MAKVSTLLYSYTQFASDITQKYVIDVIDIDEHNLLQGYGMRYRNA